MSTKLTPSGQTKSSTNLSDYPKYRIGIFGSNTYNDKQQFHKTLCAFLSELPEGSDILFITGAEISQENKTIYAPGVHDLILRWCKKFNYPCKIMQADWDKYKDKLTVNGKNPAGAIRDEEVAKVITHGIGFYEKKTPGSTHMLELCGPGKYSCSLMLVTPDKELQKELLAQALSSSRHSKSKQTFEGMNDEFDDLN